MKVKIRAERPGDWEAVHDVEAAAFGRPAEADLVDRLRQVETAMISLVAEVDGHTVGHVLFTPVSVVAGAGRVPAMALGPLAVAPECQKQGIGSALSWAGLDACRAAGHRLVFVLGHPDYYPRFGFEAARPYGIRCEFEGVPDEAFMVMPLVPDALAGVQGMVMYHPAFQGV